jgi:hypothetical protein
LYSPAQNIAIVKLLATLGCETLSIDKVNIKRLLHRDDLHPTARAVLELRQAYAYTPKVVGIARNLDPDTNRLFHAMTPAGAATGRVASHSPNLQNLHREEGDTLAKMRAILSGDVAKIAAFAPVRQVLATCERVLVAAPPGKCFFIVDFSSIEYVVVAWLADDKRMLKAFEEFFRTGQGDPYLEFGSNLSATCLGLVMLVKASFLAASSAAAQSGLKKSC